MVEAETEERTEEKTIRSSLWRKIGGLVIGGLAGVHTAGTIVNLSRAKSLLDTIYNSTNIGESEFQELAIAYKKDVISGVVNSALMGVFVMGTYLLLRRERQYPESSLE